MVVVFLPQTTRNLSNVQHPLVDNNYRLLLPELTLDKWTCVTDACTVVRAIIAAFSSPEPELKAQCDLHRSPLLRKVPTQALYIIISFLPICDIGSLTVVNREMLLLAYSEELWAHLYYQRCRTPSPLLFSSPRSGPRLERTVHGGWYWSDAREAFVATVQCTKHAGTMVDTCDAVAQELPLLLLMTMEGQACGGWHSPPAHAGTVLAENTALADAQMAPIEEVPFKRSPRSPCSYLSPFVFFQLLVRNLFGPSFVTPLIPSPLPFLLACASRVGGGYDSLRLSTSSW